MTHDIIGQKRGADSMKKRPYYRVNKYKRLVTNLTTGELISELCPFTEVHANECGAVLEPDGIAIESAIKLCKKWNGMSKRYGSPDFEVAYTIPLVRQELTNP